MAISVPVNTVDGRARLSWHRYTHLTHTQAHTAVIIIKPDCKTSLAACQSERAPNSPSRGSKTHRQVRRLRRTEPLLSLFAFSDPSSLFPLPSAVCLRSPLPTTASFHFSVLNLSSLIRSSENLRLSAGLAPGCKPPPPPPPPRAIRCQAPIRRPKGEEERADGVRGELVVVVVGRGGAGEREAGGLKGGCSLQS